MDKQELINRLISLQQRRGKILRRHNIQDVVKLGLTTKQLKSLFIIVEEEHISSKKLAEILEVTPANVTGIIDRLIERNLVIREINPDDRRVVFLMPTDKGKDIIASLEHDVTRHISSILSSMTVEDLEHFYKGLSAFIKALEENQKALEDVPSDT